ncbi:MAG TPA: penicillin-binding transpeptidase domain-containing protein [Vicinamibacterales bacterium]
MIGRAWPALAASIAAMVSAAPAAQSGGDVRSCVVIYDAARARTTRSDEKACRTRLSPASTFKIPHALVALETKVATPDGVEQWDRTPYANRPSWERDHTVLSAIRPSALWVFQRIAPRIGAARMHEWLARLRYGNADTSGPIAEYWLNGRLRISPDEQVGFLRRFYANELPLSPEHMRAVQAALVQSPGTVENSTGVHPVDGDWRSGVALSSKTGATRTASGEGVSWLVGALTVDAQQYVFATAVWRASGTVDPFEATRTTVRAFIANGRLGATKRRP